MYRLRDHAPAHDSSSHPTARARTRIGLTILALVLCAWSDAAHAQTYVDRYAQQIAGTLDVHWELISAPPDAPRGPVGCKMVEFTDGTLADAADGSVTMTGIGVTLEGCAGPNTFDLTMTPDGLSLTGVVSGAAMTLTRQPGEAAFVGDWVGAGYVFRAHVAADPFPVPDFNPGIEGEWIGWFDMLPDLPMGAARLFISDAFWDGSSWSFAALIDWDCLFDQECAGQEYLTGTVGASGAVELIGDFVENATNWTPGSYIGERSADGRTMSGTFDGGRWSFTRVSAYAVPSEVNTIQSAVDTFADRKGLRIEIEPGFYTENLDLAPLASNPGAVDITGLAAADQVVVDDGVTTIGPPIVDTNGAGGQYPLHIRNLTISGGNVFAEDTSQGGAGLRVDGGTSHLVVESCEIRDNHQVNRSSPTSYGAGVAVLGASRARFESCSIVDNVAAPGPLLGAMAFNSFGGGIGGYEGSTIEVVGSSINGNKALYGGGISAFRNVLRVVDSEVVGNNPAGNGVVGGAMWIAWGSADIIRSTTRGNAVVGELSFGGSGGGIAAVNATLRLVDAVFESNTAENGGGALALNGGSTTITRGRFGGPDGVGNRAFNPDPNRKPIGGAISGGPVTIDGTVFEGNFAEGRGGAIFFSLRAGSSVNAATFRQNRAELGGAIFSGAEDLAIIDSDFEANQGDVGGGAMWFEYSGNAATTSVVNSRLYDNWTPGVAAGAIGANNPSLTLQVIGCSIVANRAEGVDAVAAGIAAYQGTTEVYNSILWGNTSTTGSIEFQQLTRSAEAAILVEHGIVQGADPLTTTLGPGPVSGDDPLFIDLAAGDLRLGFSSPAIDAGDASFLPGYQTEDLDGNPRILGVDVDLGAYEFTGTPVGVPDDGGTPSRRIGEIASAYPNPFNPRVTISFVLDREVRTKITVHDVRGRLVRVLEDQLLPAGAHSAIWNGTDGGQRSVASGTYVVSLEAGSARDTRVVTLVK